jgi:anaerobic magnesium-protoporphyrin IX monomethyl ester cyclase
MRFLFMINPPGRRGYTAERSLSGGLGVSRRLKPWEKDQLLLPAPDILLTAAVGEQCGLKTEVIDLIVEGKFEEEAVSYTAERVRTEAGQEDDIWVGVRISIPTLPPDLRFANRLKERLPHAKVFLIGSVIMSTVDHWIHETNADAVIYGEPEAIVGDMFRAEGEGWRKARGVIDPKRYIPLKGGQLYDGSMQQRFDDWVLVKNLETVPYPAYHLVPLERYSPTGKTEDVSTYVTASRGCPIGCTMCPYMLHEGRPLRKSATDRVVDEIAWLNKNWGIYQIRFRDPNFGFDRKQVREILSKIIERGVKLDATVEVSLEMVEDDLIELMAKAGVKVITTGIESADEACLESIGQKIAVNRILSKKIALADSLGIHVYGTFVIGAPEESWETVKKTIDYSKTVPCECAFTVMTPFPGTPMYYHALKEGLLDKEMTYEKWNSFTATVRSIYLEAEDLALARLWARLELIIPYRLRQAARFGTMELIKTHVKMLPRRVALWLVRGKVAYRRRRGAKPVGVVQTPGKHIDKIPLAAKSK